LRRQDEADHIFFEGTTEPAEGSLHQNEMLDKMRIAIEQGLGGTDLYLLGRNALSEPVLQACDISEERFEIIRRELGKIKCDVEQYKDKKSVLVLLDHTNMLKHCA
jgi:hypothetical protein